MIKKKIKSLLKREHYIDRPLGQWLKKIQSAQYGEEWSVIAHAGGGTQNNSQTALTYTNSLQSVVDSIQDGKKLIELDLSVTSDNKLVAVHNWPEFKAKIGLDRIHINQKHNNEPLSYDEFVNCEYETGINTLGIDEINRIFDEHSDLVLVTDKVKNLALLKEQFNFPDRVIIETFNHRNFNDAVSLGFENLVVNIDIKEKNIANWVMKHKIKAVSFNARSVESNKRAFNNALKLQQAGVVSLAFTTNDDHFIYHHLNIAFSAFYTDYWSLKAKRSLVLGGNVTY